LRREIILLVGIKLIALLILYQLFFAPVRPPTPDGAAITAHLLDNSIP
jgi:hypothetical protein